MSTPTVTPATTEPPIASVTPAVVEPVTVQAPPSMTLAEREAEYRKNYDKSIGRDMSKFTKVEPVPSKVGEPVDPAVKLDAEGKPIVELAAAPVTPPKKKSGFARKMAALERSNLELKVKLESLEKPKETSAPTPVIVEVKEPERKDFATPEEWFTAVRKFDKDQAELKSKKADEIKLSETETAQINKQLTEFNSKLIETKKKHDDWDDIVDGDAGQKLQFNSTLYGVLITADPEILYEFGKNPKEGRRLNQLSETSIGALGSADDVTAVLRHLSKTPADIESLNELSPIKAAKFIGRIEAKIEVAKEAPKPATPAVPEPRTSPGVPAIPARAESGVPATKVEPAPRNRPEAPPVLKGAAPASDSYKDPKDMTFSERERLRYADPKFRKR